MASGIKGPDNQQADLLRENRRAERTGHDAPDAMRDQGRQDARPGDQVSLTDTARRLQNLEQRLAAEPEVNRERVEQIRSAIARGDYPVDSRRIAEKLVEIEQLLGGKG